MDVIFYILIAYLILINIVSVSVTVYDKYCAAHNRRRVRESTLLILSALGGSLAMFVTMNLIRHKTRHLKFMLGLPIILTLQFAFVYFIWRIING